MKMLAILSLLLVLVIPALADGRPGDQDVLEVFDVRDLATDRDATTRLAAQIEAVLGEEGQVESRKEGILIVRAPRPAMEEVRRLLTSIRESKNRIVTLEARFLRVTAGSTAAAGPTRQIDPEESEELLEKLSSREGVEVLAAPHLTCYSGQRATISIGEKVSYIREFEVTSTPDGGTVVDPVVDVIQDGILFEATPVLSPGVEGITVQLTCRVARVGTPMPTRTHRVGTGNVVKIQVPEVREIRLTTAITLADGSSALVDVGNDPAGGRLFLVLTVTRLDTRLLDEPDAGSGEEPGGEPK